MTARCDLTDLLVTDCACKRCRNLPDPLADEPAELGPWFAAKFDGVCSGCKEPVGAGDQIRADGTGGYLADCCGTA